MVSPTESYILFSDSSNYPTYIASTVRMFRKLVNLDGTISIIVFKDFSATNLNALSLVVDRGTIDKNLEIFFGGY